VENFEIKIINADGSAIPVMFAGSALQKILATLTLLYSSIERSQAYGKETAKLAYFLVEEPEALLHDPPLVKEYFNLLRNTTKENNICLVITSNSSDILGSQKFGSPEI
jgi:predicted ATP-dependent endonuclease of OLD family